MATPRKFQVSPMKRTGITAESNNFCSKRRKLEDTNEEWHFLRLLNNAVDYFADISNTKSENISTAISNFISSFRVNGGGGGFSEIDLNKAEYACGYLFRYGALFAGLVRKRLLQALEKIDFLKYCQKKAEINVICLGGGAGNDMIGLCSVLHEVVEFQSLNLTVVDSVKRWASFFNVMEFLIREDYYGNVSKLFQERNVNTSFICCELPGHASTNEHYYKNLQEADLILMARLWSILSDEKKEPLIRSIAENMKEDALLIFIDTWTSLDYFQEFVVVYYFEGESYNFSAPVVKKFENETATTSKAGIMILKRKNTNM
ncbi:uncharacterized protein LOC129225118 [Uloborus diversus]|uniref:uncharacterized protein LOC129225118 n=1 Tax=Uloborus diversus TaxID=327109 RepID=UPI002409E6EF|nr:uncharacterized protein LOC129225118 [Uloborus diversus]